MVRLFCLLAVGLLFAGCAELSCRPGEQRQVVDSLYFGTNTPTGQVSAKNWRTFLDTIVTPRFPKGFTSWRAAGQWRNTGGRIEQETSYILQIVHPDSQQNEKAIDEVIVSYRKRFAQESVMRVRGRACVSF